jgi:hypothetical protein
VMAAAQKFMPVHFIHGSIQSLGPDGSNGCGGASSCSRRLFLRLMASGMRK